MTFAVLSVLRDEAHHLDYFLSTLDQLSHHPRVDGLFASFYENDSVDDTASRLAAWLQGRDGSLISEQLGEERLLGRAQARTQRLALARNRALGPILEDPSVYSHLLVIDADIIFSVDQVIALLDQLEFHSDCVMACASAIQNVPDVFGESQWSYYDSWALVDLAGSGGITFAANPFQNVVDRWRWMSGLPVPVCAAFGGMALLPIEVLSTGCLAWQGDLGCEHWSFCAALRQLGSVLACPLVRPLVIHPDPVPTWSETYAQHVHDLLRI